MAESRPDSSASQSSPQQQQQGQDLRASQQESSGVSAFLLMEEMMDKLLLLNYVEEIQRKDPSFKPIHSLYFAIPNQKNPVEQFHTFIALMSWIIVDKLGVRGFSVNEYDDPTTTATNILVELKSLGIPIDFSPSRLKRAHGEEVCTVINSLLDMIIEKEGIRFRKPQFPPSMVRSSSDEDMHDEDGYDDDIDEIDDALDDSGLVGDYGDDEEEYYMDGGYAAARDAEDHISRRIVESDIDAEEWKLELEEVTPYLVLRLNLENNWKTRIEVIGEHQEDIGKIVETTSAQLKRIADDIQQALQKIELREKNLVADRDVMGISGLVDKLKSLQKDLEERTKLLKEKEDAITALGAEFNQVNQELVEVKAEVDELGKKMTDNSPLINIKEALRRIKAEIKQMDLRIGMLMRSVMQSKRQRARAVASQGRTSSLAEFDPFDMEFSEP